MNVDLPGRTSRKPTVAPKRASEVQPAGMSIAPRKTSEKRCHEMLGI